MDSLAFKWFEKHCPLILLWEFHNFLGFSSCFLITSLASHSFQTETGTLDGGYGKLVRGLGRINRMFPSHMCIFFLNLCKSVHCTVDLKLALQDPWLISLIHHSLLRPLLPWRVCMWGSQQASEWMVLSQGSHIPPGHLGGWMQKQGKTSYHLIL